MLKRKTPLKSNGFKRKEVKAKPTLSELKEKGLVRKASTLSKKRKPTGEAPVFREIWEEREHKCLTCSASIHEARAVNFSHVLPKYKYPEFRLDKRNIVLQCEYCHNKWHHYGNELREQRKWNKFFSIYDDLHEEAYNVRDKDV